MKLPFSKAVSALFAISLALQTFYFFLLPISLEGDAVAYYAYARFLAGLEPSWFQYWRPPGFPFYMHVAGLTWLDSFIPIIALNAAMGVLKPLLFFGCLLPLGRRWAFFGALVYAGSMLPYSYSKVIITEHVYSFFLLAMTFAALRLFAGARAWYFALFFAAGFVSLMIRNEAAYVTALGGLALVVFVVAHRRWKAALIGAAAATATLIAVLAWSNQRAEYVGRPELAGSLSNFSGRQMFWRLFVSLGSDAGSYLFSLPDRADPDRWNENGTRIIFVHPRNGRASAELDTLFPGYARKAGDDLSWTIGERLVAEKGILGADAFLNRVVLETFVAHPEILRIFAAQSLMYLGIDIRRPGLGKFSVWNFDTTEMISYDISGVVTHWMQKWSSAPTRAFVEYTQNYRFWERIYPTLKPLHEAGQFMRNAVRNGSGALALALGLLVIVAPFRLGALYAGAVAAMLIGFGTLGFGYNGRYEHMLTPHLAMFAIFALHAAVDRLKELRRFVVQGGSAAPAGPTGSSPVVWWGEAPRGDARK